MSITRTLAATLAVAALAAPAAQARPADMHQPAALEQNQDLRSPDARDAAQSPGDVRTTAERSLHGPPTWPAQPQTIAPASAAQPTDGGTGIDWMPIGLAGAGGLLAIAAAALTSRRNRRLHRTRVAA